MPFLPARFAGIILAFAPLFVHRSWRHAQALLIGAILCPGRRTVASVPRITGRGRERRFVNAHRVLNRAAWSPRAGGRILLRLLVDAFVPRGPIVLGLDDTIERRWGRRIRARGISRDPVRSSASHFVKTSGLRWMSLMLLADIPWAARVWALPFLTALVPSERACRDQGRQHKTLLDVGRQLALHARRWLPGRDLVLLGDSSFSALAFLDAVHRSGLTTITRLRLDAALYDPAPPRLPGTVGRPRKKGTRQPRLSERLADPDTVWERIRVPGWYGTGSRTIAIASATAVWHHGGLPVVPLRWVLIRDPLGIFEPQALLCTDLDQDPIQSVSWFVRRWQVEVTFPRGTCPSRHRDPAPVVGQGHRSYHALPARPVLDRHTAGRQASSPGTAQACQSSLVPQTAAHLLGRPGRRAPRPLARAAFCSLASAPRSHKIQTDPARGLGLRPLQRRLNGQSQAEAAQIDFAPVAFRAYAAEDVRVLIRRPGDGAFLPLVGGYAVSLLTKPPSFVRVTLARPAVTGDVLRIEGARLPSRTSDVTLAGVIRAASLEAELDRIAVTQQEHRRDLDDISEVAGRTLALLTQLHKLIERGDAISLPSTLDFLAALKASADGIAGAPRLSVDLPPDPIAAVAMTIPPSEDSRAWQVWTYARSAAPSTPFGNLVAAALGLSASDVNALAAYALVVQTETATVGIAPLDLMSAVADIAAGKPGTPRLSIVLPVDPIATVASAVDPLWDAPSRRIWQFARSTSIGSPFSNLVRDSLGLSTGDMLIISVYMSGAKRD